MTRSTILNMLQHKLEYDGQTPARLDQGDKNRFLAMTATFPVAKRSRKPALVLGHAIVWGPTSKEQTLTDEVLDIIIDEAKEAGAPLPVHIWSGGNTAASCPELYRFHYVGDI